MTDAMARYARSLTLANLAARIGITHGWITRTIDDKAEHTIRRWTITQEDYDMSNDLNRVNSGPADCTKCPVNPGYPSQCIHTISRRTLIRCLESAKCHGEQSEPDHEVGDLLELIEALFVHMTDGQRAEAFESYLETRELWSPT